jgi:hypothetical protein
MMSLQNIMSCRMPGSFDLVQLAALAVAPEVTDVAIYQRDMFTSLLATILDSNDAGDHTCDHQAQLLEESLAALMTTSHALYIEIPTKDRLAMILGTLTHLKPGSAGPTSGKGSVHINPSCADFILTRYDSSIDILRFAAKRLDLTSASSKGKIVITEIPDIVDTDEMFNTGTSIFRVDVDIRNVALFGKRTGYEIANGKRLQVPGISLYSLLHLGMSPSIKKSAFRLMTRLPVWSSRYKKDSECYRDYHPWSLMIGVEWDPIDISELGAESNARNSTSMSETTPKMTMWYTGVHGDRDIRISRSSCKIEDPQNSVRAGQLSRKSDTARAMKMWNILNKELMEHEAEVAEGSFSLVEHGSNFGRLSSLFALKYPNATIISLESNLLNTQRHVEMINKLEIENNAVCWTGASQSSKSSSPFSTMNSNSKSNANSLDQGTQNHATIVKHIYESPELFRFQVIGETMFDSYMNSLDLNEWGTEMGAILSSALTSFIEVPSPDLISLAMETFFAHDLIELKSDAMLSLRGLQHGISGPYRSSDQVFGDSRINNNKLDQKLMSKTSISSHPTSDYESFDALFLLGLTKAPSGSTQMTLKRLSDERTNDISGAPPIVRCDIVNMTRHVHHHYDWAKDGHTRTYTMHVVVNHTTTSQVMSIVGDVSKASYSFDQHNGITLIRPSTHAKVLLPLGNHPSQHNIVSVSLSRDRDNFPIPYIAIRGVTLITVLRMGLEDSLREKFYKLFLELPLYEDMAPWNVVLTGPKMDYIDFDTKGITYDVTVPKAYQVMTVLMNYERSVKDFHKCGSKAHTVYGLPYVSDCVGDTSSYNPKKEKLNCPDLAFSVPCADGTCHSDYISCLKSMSKHANDPVEPSEGGAEADWTSKSDAALSKALVDSIFSGHLTGTFGADGMV